MAAKSNRARTKAAEEQYLNYFHEEYRRVRLGKKQTKLICALIYWCEGAKNTDRVDFTNADADLVRLFLKFFRESFEIDEKSFGYAYIYIHTITR